MSANAAAEAAAAVKKALADAEEHAHVTVRERQVGAAQMPITPTTDSVTATYEGQDYVLEKLNSLDYQHGAEYPVLVLRLPDQQPRCYEWFGGYWRVLSKEHLAQDPEKVETPKNSDPVLDWTNALVAAVPSAYR